jgi:hypothetical protein
MILLEPKINLRKSRLVNLVIDTTSLRISSISLETSTKLNFLKSRGEDVVIEIESAILVLMYFSYLQKEREFKFDNDSIELGMNVMRLPSDTKFH